MKIRLVRTRRRIRVVGKGLATLAAIYGRDGNLRQMAGQVWFVATREGLIGVKHWLERTAPVIEVEDAPPEDAEPDADAPPSYAQWLERFDPLQHDLPAAQRHLATLHLPDLLILAIVTPDSLASFGRVAASWQDSIHPGWRAAVVGCGGLSPAEMATLRSLVAGDARISVLTTAEEVEAARERFAYALLCFGGTLLNSLSAYMFIEAAVRTGAGVVYADNDRVDDEGQRHAPDFKPQLSPEYIAHYNYIGDCLLVSRGIVFSPEPLLQPTLAAYDRLVAQLAQGRHAEHIPFVLSHTIGQPPRVPHDLPVYPDTGPGVAIIIPTRDGLEHLQPCIDSIREKTSYDLGLVEIVVVDNNSGDPETLEYLASLDQQPNATVARYPHPFNFAELNNIGARATSRDVLVFLNNDTLVHDPAWLSKLVWYAKQPGAGAVGAKLLFPDGTIQHGGCVAGGSLGTVQHLLSYADPAEIAATDHTREMSLMTGACLAVCRAVFDQVGGFDNTLKVTWNDVKFCLACLTAGLRNIYVADPLLIHNESRTRGHDDTREKLVRYFSEADYTRRMFRGYFYDDPSYNPNLSLEQAGELAVPPRTRRPWSRMAGQPSRILLLSVVYKIGYGVPVVIQQHAKALKARGYDVVIGGPAAENEFSFPGCERVLLGSAKEAATYAFETDVALIVSHTPPFFEVPIYIGGQIPVLAYDYGEPAAEFFGEPTRSYLLNVGYQKRAAAALTTRIATISQAVKDETLNRDAVVLGLANSHLPAWSEALRPERGRVRQELGWEDCFVILTVCRFHENERAYKGLDKIEQVLREFAYLYPGQSKPLVWALAGAGTESDVEQVERLGFTVFPNVTDARLTELYKGADAYMGFSRWEGYNLGISQALAMGLPTIGSDIPAHREFPIVTSNSTLAVCSWLAQEVEARTADGPDRRATVYEWGRSTARFAEVVEDMLEHSAAQAPRLGASACPDKTN